MDMKRRNQIIDVFGEFLKIVAYAAIFVIVATFFKSFVIDDEHLYIYGITATLIIFFLNKTIKPLLVVLTIPITGITVGLFYPCINWFILKLTDWILGSHFQMTDLFTSFLLAILISFVNTLFNTIIVKPLVRRLKNNG